MASRLVGHAFRRALQSAEIPEKDAASRLHTPQSVLGGEVLNLGRVWTLSRQLRERLGLSPATFFRRKAAKAFKHLEVRRPVGTFRYSEAKVAAFLAGASTVSFREVTA